ncbi:MAG: hypothetical protein HN366_05005 [Deltaproteobacteria bacterium]|nr:hypothetical protein [Deltaproteobacteria bacterium]
MRFEFPEELLFNGILVIFIFQMNQVQTFGISVKRLDGRYDAAPVSHGGKHAGAGD